MKRILALLCMAMIASAAIADNHIPTYAAVETFGCKYKVDKNAGDMAAWASKGNKQAEKIYSEPYRAMMFTPFLTNPVDQPQDFYWVGVSPNFAAQGAIQDEWNAKGGKVAQELTTTVDCDSHATWAMTTVRSNENAAPPSSGVATFQACTMHEGKTMQDLKPADAKMNVFLDKIGQASPMWRWWPISGQRSASKIDFMTIAGQSSLKQKGASMDNFVKNGGLQVRSSI